MLNFYTSHIILQQENKINKKAKVHILCYQNIQALNQNIPDDVRHCLIIPSIMDSSSQLI